MKQTATKPRSTAKRTSKNGPGPAYLALINRLPLRPLRSELDYNAAAAILDSLAVRPECDLDRGEQDYFDTLTLLVEAYDREHFADAAPRDPIELLKFLMQESGTTQADLGRLLGNRALASLILNKHRQLSKSHIVKLAKHFKVSTALFLGASWPANFDR